MSRILADLERLKYPEETLFTRKLYWLNSRQLDGKDTQRDYNEAKEQYDAAVEWLGQQQEGGILPSNN
jgi:hypothetical protein